MKTKARLLLIMFVFALFSLQACNQRELCPAYSDTVIEAEENIDHA